MGQQLLFTYGGRCLDKEIQGFRTLAVTGREELTQDIDDVDLASDGALYLSTRLKQKTLKVSFFLRCSTLSERHLVTAKLKQLLLARNTTVNFSDDSLYHYIGSVSKLEVDKTTLSSTGSIEIELSDPYSYSETQILSGTGNIVKFNNSYGETGFSNKPIVIEFTPAASITTFQITSNQQKKFILNQAVSAGKKIVINFEKLTCTVAELNVLADVSLNSNFADFEIDHDTVITFNASGAYTIRFEVKKL
jgi:uncharacterized protein YkvS|nr:MAG TPA_asm: Receptor binding protein [Caudoviricetes sp.]